MRKLCLFLAICLVFSFSAFAAKVDLAISSADVTISPNPPAPGSAVTVTITIHNIGIKDSKATKIKLKVLDGKAVIFNQKNVVPVILAGGSYETSFNLGALDEGTYSLTFKVDPANQFKEVSKSNNKVVMNMTVAGGGGIGTPTISSVADLDPNALTGVEITWSPVEGATGYDLLFDSTTTFADVVSPHTIEPGDSSPHSYQVRAKNETLTGAWSAAVSGTDKAGGSSGSSGTTSASIVSQTMSSFSTGKSNVGAGGALASAARLSPEFAKVLESIPLLKKYAGNDPETVTPCSKGGTMDSSITLDAYYRPSKIVTTYNNCEQWVDQSQNIYIVSNGVMTINFEYKTDSFTDYLYSKMTIIFGDGDPSADTQPDYVVDYYDEAGKVEKVVNDFVLTMTISIYANNIPSDFIIDFNGASNVTDNWVTPPISYEIEYSHLQFHYTLTGTSEDMNMTAIVSGTITATNLQYPSQSGQVTYNNLEIRAHITPAQEELWITGSVVFEGSGPCDGTYTFSTPAPVITFTGDDCPDSGTIKVTGAVTATITYSNGSVTVDDGTGSTTFTPCSGASGHFC